MKRTMTMVRSKTTILMIALIGTFAASESGWAATKVCTGGTCAVPTGVDCSTYGEVVWTGTLNGGTVPHNGVVLTTLVNDNTSCCPPPNPPMPAPKVAHLNYSKTTTRTVNLTFTGSTTASASIKGAAGVPLLANAEVTAGLSTTISTSVGGSETSSTTVGAVLDFSTPCGYRESARIVADWVSGAWNKTAYMHSYYFNDSTGNWENTDCDLVTGNSSGVEQYTNFTVQWLASVFAPNCGGSGN